MEIHDCQSGPIGGVLVLSAFFAAGFDLIIPLDGLRCQGLSMIVGPRGEVLVRAGPSPRALRPAHRARVISRSSPVKAPNRLSASTSSKT